MGECFLRIFSVRCAKLFPFFPSSFVGLAFHSSFFHDSRTKLRLKCYIKWPWSAFLLSSLMGGRVCASVWVGCVCVTTCQGSFFAFSSFDQINCYAHSKTIDKSKIATSLVSLRSILTVLPALLSGSRKKEIKIECFMQLHVSLFALLSSRGIFTKTNFTSSEKKHFKSRPASLASFKFTSRMICVGTKGNLQWYFSA